MPVTRAEQRLEQLQKQVRDLKIQVLQKQLETTTDPAVKADIGFRLTYERLRRLNQAGGR